MAEYPGFNYILEEHTLTQMEWLIKDKPEWAESCYYQIMVDDMIFYREVNLSEALFRLVSDDTLYAVHLKLHPGINYSHTNDKIIGAIPKF